MPPMRRAPLALALVVAALGLGAAGCGGEEQQSATPETVQGTVPTTPTETTETTTESTQSTGTTSTETTGTTSTETTGTSTTPTAKGDPAAGKQVFLSVAACGGCHTLSDAGSTGNVGPNLDDVKPTYDKVVTQVTNGGGAMPAFKGTLTPQQIADVAAYVSSVAGK
jgi:mono/diheme cytochrome c family protein